MIEQKVGELGRFLTGKSPKLDFVEPAPKLERIDNRELRAKILALSVSEGRQLNIGKSTLHYLREKSKSDKSFSVYAGIREKLAEART